VTTLLYSHEACLAHEMGSYHPECPARLEAVLAALAEPEFAALERREAPRASRAQLALVHPAAYIDAVFDCVPQRGLAQLDPDTALCPASGEAALRAAGALCAAVDAVIAGEAENAFCAVRPPGHHAEPTRAMGFCVFSNVAIAAQHARAAHGLARAAVVDFDVHHGNGTQAAFWDEPELFFASSHQMPLYPGTGSSNERGVAGNIVNVPLAPLSGSAEFRRAMSDIILPALRAFRPEFVFISAGFDAHVDDPLANLCFEDDDYGWATGEIRAVARELCDGRLVSTLEGGYDLEALGRSAAAHVRALMTP
jgi:acetoin utilization deacetylase AcuC-like enzyme